LDVVLGFFDWIGRNEAVLSGIAASIVILGVLFSPLGVGLRRLFGGREAAPKPPAEATTAPSAPRRPSIAVLPFATPSGQPALEALAEGLVDDLVNALGRVRHFDVIARSATAAWKGGQADLQAVARELGAHYAVEGSVRAIGERVRVTVQLVAADTRTPVWSDRHECDPAGLDAAHDEITARIAAELQPAVRRAEAERARGRPAASLGAWALVNRGWVTLQGGLGSSEAAQSAIADCERALEIEPDDALGQAVLAHARSLLRPTPGSAAAEQRDVLGPIRRAIELAGHDPAVQHCYAAVLGNLGRTADAVRAWERCLELDPFNAPARAGLGIAQIYMLRPEDGLANIERALRLSPRDPLVYHWLAQRALACEVLGRHAEAAAAARESVERSGTRVGWGVLALAESQLGHLEGAREAWRELEARTPGFDANALERMIRSVCPDPATAESEVRAVRRIREA
jgi:TolB-like protein